MSRALNDPTVEPVTRYENLPHRYASPHSQDTLSALRAGMSEAGKRASEDMFSKATGYGWGRVDSPGFQWPAHQGDALDFAVSFAIHCAEGGHTWAIREAYDMWHATGRITK